MGGEAGEWRDNELQMILREDRVEEDIRRESEDNAHGKGKGKMGTEEKNDESAEKAAKKWKKWGFLHRGKKVRDTQRLLYLNQQLTYGPRTKKSNPPPAVSDPIPISPTPKPNANKMISHES